MQRVGLLKERVNELVVPYSAVSDHCVIEDVVEGIVVW